jgi:hypothetical protein
MSSPLNILHTYSSVPLSVSIPITIIFIILTAITQNVIKQLFFADSNEPPLVFHIFPVIGSTIQYGMDPYKFFFDCRAQYGDCFTFILLGKPTTVYLGAKGNNFILNGRHADLNAEEIYGKLTTPCFGKGVVYDCSNERLMDQKRVRISYELLIFHGDAFNYMFYLKRSQRAAGYLRHFWKTSTNFIMSVKFLQACEKFKTLFLSTRLEVASSLSNLPSSTRFL